MDSLLCRFLEDAVYKTPGDRMRTFDELISHACEDALDRGELIELATIALCMADIQDFFDE